MKEKEEARWLGVMDRRDQRASPWPLLKQKRLDGGSSDEATAEGVNHWASIKIETKLATFGDKGETALKRRCQGAADLPRRRADTCRLRRLNTSVMTLA